ncbi:mitochondrial intermembrane space import and assembly protein 40-B [Microplitis demolitor]|uniref:mitochondrial intermembrane space import and assembly protein 40-B n=1 Tax=Microplitis demolitor TaxID=69319 RepID=UPI0004CD1AD7|nr:mitochondrial intermembrane space import and assembly protein 40-B [Microplitis demolitor]
MSTEQKEEKDIKISAAKEDNSSPKENNSPESESAPGLLLPDGEINWDCPCLDGMASGPCGSEFKKSFSCMFTSVEGQNNADCLVAIKTLFSCMSKYPDYYRDKGFSDEILEMDEQPETNSTNDEKDSENNLK